MFAAIGNLFGFIFTLKFGVGLVVGVLGHKTFAAWFAAAKAKAQPVITSIGSKV